jgi:RNA-directed DNA polymerase
VNTDVLWPDLELAESQVLRIQIKLHRWAIDDPDRRFDDLFNLVCDPAVLVVAWARVRGNRGKRAAGVDGLRPQSILSAEEQFLPQLRHDLKARRFTALAVRERMIPKPGSTKLRRLGIPTARDRTVQAALKLVLEPILEADFQPCSYGFRPRRRAQDAIAEIHQFASRSYEWVLEGDIEACFDMIDHPALMDRVRRRIGDKRVLAVVKAFLHAGVLGEDGIIRDSTTGTPQGGILSPLLANVALSVLDEHFAEVWRADSGSTYQRTKRRRAGLANYRIVRYADDFVVLVSGTQAHAEAVREDVAGVLAPMGLRLSEAKTKVCHIDEGFDFLGFRIQRRRKRGTTRRVVYTYPSKKALASIVGRVRTLTRRSSHPTLAALLR